MPTDCETFLDVRFDVLPEDKLLARIAEVSADGRYRYLVTPNVDHMVRLAKRRDDLPDLAKVYREADLCVCDSKVLARLAKWRGVSLPVVPGSDLTGHLFDRVVEKGDRISIIGGDEAMLAELRSRYHGIQFVQHCPPMGLMQNSAARSSAAQFISDQQARFTFICVGSPQQELIANEAGSLDGSRGLALCVGASLDFLTGRERRAPHGMRRLGLEWAYRLLSDPQRMWRRYLVEGPAIFLMAYRWQKNAT